MTKQDAFRKPLWTAIVSRPLSHKIPWRLNLGQTSSIVGERANGYHPAPEARGYCPLHIRDLLKDGRYRVLHKIWGGGNSTVWAARDLREGKYVTLKIGVTGGEKPSRELEVLQKISASPSEHTGSRNLVRLHDSFVIERPYGSHECLVLDLLGGNPQFMEGRGLPANVAKRMAKEVLLGLDCLHSQGITHGDLHAGNLSCVMLPLDHLDEHEFCEKFGEIDTYNMKRKDGKPIGPGVPRYLVLPGAFPKFFLPLSNDINGKIVDFGESFLKEKAPETVDTTQCLKPPEVMFGDPLDHRLDMWSMGCLKSHTDADMLWSSLSSLFPTGLGPITPEEYAKGVLDHLVP
ncbi:kinase-like domain-containing protein [Phyllosticta capitalensis]|uniref:non-specific serine/threonine protein kinase n=1 Tax=Phyllosticta capitalensis TaxID=121624 RepID=A0ABR1YH96_9PEZI